MINITLDLFQKGYSCSESIVRGAYEAGYLDKEIDIELLNAVSSPFSGGMSSGCICGAISGAQIVLGAIKGRKDKSTSPSEMKAIAKEFTENFKAKRKATCCAVLTRGFEFNSSERRQNCALIVTDAASILQNKLESLNVMSEKTISR